MMNKRFACFAVLLLLTSGVSYAGTCGSADDGQGSTHATGTAPWTADSPAYADVNYCINTAASEGDTIHVPAGSARWDSPLFITTGKTILGTGAGSTIITSGHTSVNGQTGDPANFLIAYVPTTPSNDTPFRISGFTFDFDDHCSGILIDNDSATAITQVRIDNNVIRNATAVSMSARAICINGTIYGVIDNNTFSGNTKHIDAYGANATAWTNLTFGFGSADQMFYEDNTFTIENTPHSGGAGGRYCARYNTYSYPSPPATSGLYPWFDAHGNQEGANHATMGVEIYGNYLNSEYVGAGVGFFDHRGGMGVLFYNRVDALASCSTKIREEYADTYNLPASGPSGQTQHVADAYYWNNRVNGTTLVNPTVTQDTVQGSGSADNNPPLIVENREFWNHHAAFDGTSGMGCGTLAARPATCTTGVGYWATDQSCSAVSMDQVGADPATPISGTFYRCAAADTWTEYFTPYTYPHPLREDTTPELPTPESETGSSGGGCFVSMGRR